MKIDVCDICFMKTEELKKSKYRVGFTGGMKASVCQEHKDFFKAAKTSDEFGKIFYGLSNERWKE